MLTTTDVVYNAFGEVTLRGSNGVNAEYAKYDNAGRMWNSNTEKGVNTVYLYDLPRDFITTFKSKIEALTTADIQKAATKYFDQSGFAAVIVGDYDKVKDQVATYGEVTLLDTEGNPVTKTASK